MPKKIKFESFIYRFLIEANNYKKECHKEDLLNYINFLENLSFEYLEKKAIIKSIKDKAEIKLVVPLNEQSFYIRGDSEESISKQKIEFLNNVNDPVMDLNKDYFTQLVKKSFNLFLFGDPDSNIPS